LTQRGNFILTSGHIFLFKRDREVHRKSFAGGHMESNGKPKRPGGQGVFEIEASEHGDM